MRKLALEGNNYMLFGSNEIGSVNKQISHFLNEISGFGLRSCSLDSVKALGYAFHEKKLFSGTIVVPVKDKGNTRFFFFNPSQRWVLDQERLDERKPGDNPLPGRYDWCFFVEKPEMLVNLAIFFLERIDSKLKGILKPFDYEWKMETTLEILRTASSSLPNPLD